MEDPVLANYEGDCTACSTGNPDTEKWECVGTCGSLPNCFNVNSSNCSECLLCNNNFWWNDPLCESCSTIDVDCV